MGLYKRSKGLLISIKSLRYFLSYFLQAPVPQNLPPRRDLSEPDLFCDNYFSTAGMVADQSPISLRPDSNQSPASRCTFGDFCIKLATDQ